MCFSDIFVQTVFHIEQKKKIWCKEFPKIGKQFATESHPSEQPLSTSNCDKPSTFKKYK